MLKEADELFAMVIEKARLEDSGSYSCQASNDSGDVSGVGNLTVNGTSFHSLIIFFSLFVGHEIACSSHAMSKCSTPELRAQTERRECQPRRQRRFRGQDQRKSKAHSNLVVLRLRFLYHDSDTFAPNNVAVFNIQEKGWQGARRRQQTHQDHRGGI